MGRTLLPALCLLALCHVIGCGDEDGPVVPDPEPEFTPPASQVLLMEGFKTSFEDMDIDLYGDLLDPRFRFFFLDPADGSWDKTEDTISTDNMFSGEALTNNHGELTKAIDSIVVDRLDLVDSWREIPDTDPDYGDVEGAVQALYDLKIVLYHNDAGVNSAITIECQQTFLAAPIVYDTGNGTEATGWLLLAQRDQWFKSNEDISFSSVKSLFR